MIDHRSYGHSSSSCYIKAWKYKAWTVFQPMTSAIPVQCSTNATDPSSQLGAGDLVRSYYTRRRRRWTFIYPFAFFIFYGYITKKVSCNRQLQVPRISKLLMNIDDIKSLHFLYTSWQTWTVHENKSYFYKCISILYFLLVASSSFKLVPGSLALSIGPWERGFVSNLPHDMSLGFGVSGNRPAMSVELKSVGSNSVVASKST